MEDLADVFDDIQLLDDQGVIINTIVASEMFAEWYVANHGGTWRHRPIEVQPEE